MKLIKSKVSLCINIFMIVTVLCIINTFYISEYRLEVFIGLGIALCILGNFQLYFSRVIDNELEIDSLKSRVKELEGLNKTILINIEKYDKEILLINKSLNSEVLGEIDSLMELEKLDSELNKLENMSVRTLIYNKCKISKEEDVLFLIEVKSNLNNIIISSVDLCTILSNLIDNATRHSKTSLKSYVRLVIDEDENNHIIHISNNGQSISSDLKGDMFKFGITTKKEIGHGMGLYIINKIINKNKGSIEFNDKKGFFEFVVNIPKRHLNGNSV